MPSSGPTAHAARANENVRILTDAYRLHTPVTMTHMKQAEALVGGRIRGVGKVGRRIGVYERQRQQKRADDEEHDDRVVAVFRHALGS